MYQRILVPERYDDRIVTRIVNDGIRMCPVITQGVIRLGALCERTVPDSARIEHVYQGPDVQELSLPVEFDYRVVFHIGRYPFGIRVGRGRREIMNGRLLKGNAEICPVGCREHVMCKTGSRVIRRDAPQYMAQHICGDDIGFVPVQQGSVLQLDSCRDVLLFKKLEYLG